MSTKSLPCQTILPTITQPSILFPEEELREKHSGIPHGGIRDPNGKSGWEEEHSHVIEYRLKLDSNPEFTACVLAAYARAAFRLYREGRHGCLTVLDVAPSYLASETPEMLRKQPFKR